MNNLNFDQRKAVESDGVVVIVAGPGTGKTKTLTSRIAHLLEEKKVDPEKILALTFTKKAATEMKTRLRHIKNLPFIGTFHAFATQFLQGSGFRIIDEKEQLSILEMIVLEHKKKTTQKDVKNLLKDISISKNDFSESKNSAIIDTYNKFLQDNNLLDFDDLLLLLFKKINQVKDFRYEYVLVDEFQDTNRLQYEIIKNLVLKDNLFVIGDPLQSIYAFRGADAYVFEKIKQDFPHHAKIALKKNYRSAKNILDTASRLFIGASTLTSIKGKIGVLQLILMADEHSEADWVVQKIYELIGGADLIQASDLRQENVKKHTLFADIAVIYRTHQIGRILEKRFLDSGIPYQMIGGDSPYEQAEIAFIIAILQYVLSKKSQDLKNIFDSSLLRISHEARFILHDVLKDEKTSDISAIIHDLQGLGKLKPKDIKILSTLNKNNDELLEYSKSYKLIDFIHKTIEIFSLDKRIIDKPVKQQNLQQFVNNLLQFADKKDAYQNALDYLTYLQEHEYYDPRAQKVTLLTMHAAKGLEFDTVFICGFEEGLIPLVKTKNTVDLDEEKRLLYVAMTRAKQNLYLTYTNNRFHKKTNISSFYRLLKNKDMEEVEDAAIEKQKKRKEKWLIKKSQIALFD